MQKQCSRARVLPMCVSLCQPMPPSTARRFPVRKGRPAALQGRGAPRTNFNKRGVKGEWLGIPCTVLRAPSSVAKGPSVLLGLGASRVPDQLSFPLVAT